MARNRESVEQSSSGHQSKPARLIPPQIEASGLSMRPGWALLGDGVAVRQLRSQIERIAPYIRCGLIRGEIGAGKLAVAQAIHALSSRAAGPFLACDASRAVSCTTPDGANWTHSPASATEMAKAASEGTLYLAGVAELSIEDQAGLMRFLRACDDRQPGSSTRIVAGTRRDLRSLVALGQFRNDLYERLSAVEILVPPLRHRAEDIGALADALLCRMADQFAAVPTKISPAAVLYLQQQPWPQNLRDLQRSLQQAAARASGATIEGRHLESLMDMNVAQGGPTRLERLEAVVERHVMEVLSHCGGNKLRAAEVLGISRSTLYRMLGSMPDAKPARE